MGCNLSYRLMVFPDDMQHNSTGEEKGFHINQQSFKQIKSSGQKKKKKEHSRLIKQSIGKINLKLNTIESKNLTIFPWMLLNIELWTQPRLSVLKEKCLSTWTTSSTITTVGLKTKKLTSKFLLSKGTEHAILLFVCILTLPFEFQTPPLHYNITSAIFIFVCEIKSSNTRSKPQDTHSILEASMAMNTKVAF